MDSIDGGGPTWLALYITPNLPWLVDNLTVDLPFLHHLMTEGLLDQNDIETIEAITESRRRVHELFYGILRGKGDGALEKIYSALKKSNREFIFTRLQETQLDCCSYDHLDPPDAFDRNPNCISDRIPGIVNESSACSRPPSSTMFTAPEFDHSLSGLQQVPSSSHPLSNGAQESLHLSSREEDLLSKVSALEKEVCCLKGKLREKTENMDKTIACFAESFSRQREKCELLRGETKQLQEENRNLCSLLNAMSSITLEINKVKALQLENQYLKNELDRLKHVNFGLTILAAVPTSNFCMQQKHQVPVNDQLFPEPSVKNYKGY